MAAAGGHRRIRTPAAAAALTLAIVLLTGALASVLVYYESPVLSYPQRPLIALEESNDVERVNVSLGVNATNASITVNASSDTGYIIGLLYRAAVYWSSFDTDPFAEGILYVKNPDANCNWTWNPAGYVTLVAYSRAASEGGECIALVNRTLDASPHNYINYVFRVREGFGYIDTIYYGPLAAGAFYTVGAQEVVSDFWNFFGYNDNTTIWLYDGATWTLLAYYDRNIRIYKNVWYDMTSFRNDTSGRLALYSGTGEIVSAYDSTIDVKYGGIGGYYTSGANLTIDFDLLLITVGAPPFYVNVTGLEPGWYVRILDSQGNVLADGTAQGETLALEAWRWKFAANATIEVYTDSTLATLVASGTFDWVVGGDLYLVSNSTSGASLNLFNAYNEDPSTTYYVGVRLLNFTPVNGSFSNISIWATVADASTGRIEVANGIVYSSDTGLVALPPQYRVYVYIFASGDPGSRALLELRFYYEVGGVRVEYPVLVEVEV